MARINSYPQDVNITGADAWIGTDSATRQTKQFSAAAVANFLNITGSISIAGQMGFKFLENNPIAGSFTGPTSGDALNSITTIQLSQVDSSGQNVVEFIRYITGNNILISQSNQISTFSQYTIDSYVDLGGGFYNLNLTNIGGSGNITEGILYDFTVFNLSSQSSPTFIFEQAVPSDTWNITHDMVKFPSITVIDTVDSVVQGEYTYVNNNNVILTFTAPFAGKAYLN
jgi:hypothetical protein